MTTRQRHEQQARTYRVLIDIARKRTRGARENPHDPRQGRVHRHSHRGTARAIEHFCRLGDCVIDQSRRRVLLGEQLATDEKIYSIFEPHTDLIKRGKVRTPVEFSDKVFLAESAAGLITQYEVLRGKPPTRSTWQFPSNATGSPLAGPRNCTAQIMASSGSRTSPRASTLASKWRAFLSVAARGRHDGWHMRRIRPSRMVSAFAPASRAHLGAVPRPRHEALSCQRTRPLRIVGRRRRARQQSHEDRGNAGDAIAAQTKSRFTDTQARFPARSEPPRLNLSQAERLPSNTEPKLETRPLRGLLIPVSAGILCPIHRDNLDHHRSIRAFRDRTRLGGTKFVRAEKPTSSWRR